MWAFLMNCPVNYSEEPVSTQAAVKHLLPVNIPMKLQFPWTAASPGECVDTKSIGTSILGVNPGLISVLPDSRKKNVTWKDALLSRNESSLSIEPLRIWPTVE
jgi:hypothetical protein